ncbi:MAG TPA: NADH:ubiquinone reductase (Na(+)-transporting) subunit F [Verrucomicrobia bacterium]|nr:MAG: NADH:ubiquinone reductase (Na(+)-transporting) subunit F [Lentisphaerae bacterium GWF2_57_35]HBA84353.1 NADH:ubiquinone reductase (Na(+)-transporting) subunit F [Verrucomicrobiota bacterium]
MGSITVILTSVVVFTGLILLLTIGLMIASKRLVTSGPIKIDVNEGAKLLTVDAGSTLLSSLATQKIFLPSACGGGGTCAMCKCKVLDGGGTILPTETGHINRQQAREGLRLACQLKVKRDLKIEVPPEILEIKKFEGTVRSNRNVATFIKELSIDLPEGMHLNFKAGGYIQIDIPPYELDYKDFDIDERFRDAWDKFKLWDFKAVNPDPCFRAYSMGNYPAEGNIVMLNVRIATPPPKMDVPPGIASSYMFALKPGDKVTLSGPFGEFFAKDTQREMVYIGGGAGMAPLRSHLFDLLKTKKAKRKISYWYGARSLREMFYEQDFRTLEKECPNFSFILALSEPMPEDHWKGATGFIHSVVLQQYLSKHEDPGEIEYYLCGPPPMIAAVNKMLYDLGVEKEMIAYDEF